MNNTLKTTVILICLLVRALIMAADNQGNKEILIINTYTESTPWSNSFIHPIVNMVSKDAGVGIYTIHLNMLTLQDSKDLTQIKRDIVKVVSGHTPKLIVLIGTASFILCKDMDRQWPSIPMLLCGERDYTGPDSLVINSQPLALEQRVFIKDLQGSLNLTLLHACNYIDENLQLMKRLIPQMKQLFYIGDGTYICQQIDYDLRETIKKKHSYLRYEFLSSQNISTDNLFSRLYHESPDQTGVLFSSWIRQKDLEDNLIMTTNSHRIIATSPIPLFSLRTVGIEGTEGLVGGYVYNKKRFIEQLLKTIRDILEGKQPRDIPIYHADKASPVFNYPFLIQHHFNPKSCPANTIFYNAPLTFWEQYEYIIIGFGFIIVVLLLLFQYYRIRTLQKMRYLQQKESASINKYNNLVNNMPVFYLMEELIKDENGKIIEATIVDVNKSFEKVFYKRKDVIGKTASEIFPDSMPQFLHFMNIAMNEQRSVTFSFYFNTMDTFYDIVVNLSNNERYIDIFCLDSTELHQTQKQLRSINRKLSMAIQVANIIPWRWNLQDHTFLRDVEKSAELNDTHQETSEQIAITEEQYFNRIHKDDIDRVRNAYKNLIAGHIQKVKEEFRVINHIDGNECIEWMEAQAAIESYDENGKPLSLVGSSLVITGRKKMENELISAKNKAEESNRLKSAFLANMSHEIRTPLNAIVGFSGILASTEQEEDRQEYISIIENNNMLLLQLVNDILDLSKIEAGTMDFINTDFNLNKVMEELESSLRMKLFPDKDVTLICECQLPECNIHAERNRISQILINLVTNAIKFTDKGSIRFGYEKRSTVLYFYVSDTGCGIPEEQQEAVFGRFVKLNNFAQGTGLGLAICKTLIQYMGGEIGLISKINQGSTFWFTLPYVPASFSKQHKRQIVPLKIQKQEVTVLIAEDCSSNYRLIESILSKDYQLVHAWDGKEAVDLFKRHNPQLILMDINMPIMDGYETIKEIRKFDAEIPIIAITAFGYTSDEQKVIQEGFDAYMTKPINASKLREQVNSILKQRLVFI